MVTGTYSFTNIVYESKKTQRGRFFCVTLTSINHIEPNQLKIILQRSDVVNSPATGIDNGIQFVRTVDVGETIGNVSIKYGGGTTSWIKIFADKAGNLITTYPVPAP